MRVSNTTLRHNVMRNLNLSLRELAKAQRQMASGQIVNQPSDNPIVAARLINIDSALSESTQLKTNVRDGLAWLNMTDVTLGDVADSLHRARELALAGANATLTPEIRDYNAREVDQLLRHVLSLANASFDGDRYLFGGTHFGSQPFLSSDVSGNIVIDPLSSGGDGPVNYEILRGMALQVNIEGRALFMNGGIFEALAMTRDALAETPTENINDALGALEDALDNALDARATVGARQNRLQMAERRYEEEQTTLTELRSKLGDVDMAEAIMNFNVREHVYQAALGAAARVMQPTLLDFLR